MARYRNSVKFGTSGLQDFRNTTKALTHIDRELPRDFKRSISEVATDLRDKARAAALREPAVGKHGTTGLRKDVAKGVGTVSIPGGTRIQTSMPRSNEAVIPRGMDDIKGWRHPVFGNKQKWVTQTSGSDSWFMETMRGGAVPLREKLERNLEDAADTVDNAS